MTPLISEIHGVKILVYSREHLPAHMHVVYADDEILIEIRTGKTMKGELHPRKLKLILQWLNVESNRLFVEETFYLLNPHLRLTEDYRKP